MFSFACCSFETRHAELDSASFEAMSNHLQSLLHEFLRQAQEDGTSIGVLAQPPLGNPRTLSELNDAGVKFVSKCPVASIQFYIRASYKITQPPLVTLGY